MGLGKSTGLELVVPGERTRISPSRVTREEITREDGLRYPPSLLPFPVPVSHWKSRYLEIAFRIPHAEKSTMDSFGGT